MDHLRRHTLHLEQLKTVILDEADEMLDMGFREDIEDILVSVPEERQTVLFSATMPPEIMAITDRFQNDPVLIKAASKSMTVESVEQYYYDVPMGRKTDALVLLLRSLEPKLSMVFCNTKKMVDELTDSLVSKGFRAAGLHGDMKQQSRTQTLNAFKSGRINILIATDVAARGIDIDGIDAVFNYDIPQDNEYYIHRIGRTGRAGKTGCAYTLAGGRGRGMNPRGANNCYPCSGTGRCVMPGDTMCRKPSMPDCGCGDKPSMPDCGCGNKPSMPDCGCGNKPSMPDCG